VRENGKKKFDTEEQQRAHPFFTHQILTVCTCQLVAIPEKDHNELFDWPGFPNHSQSKDGT
jgi:hypothetical protein